MALLQSALSYQQGAINAIGKAAELQQQREIAQEQMKRAEDAQQMSQIGAGAGIGAAIGASYGAAGGPIGALIGAGIGYLASEVF